MNRLMLASPLGPLLVEHDGESLRSIRYWRQGDHPPAGTRDQPAAGDRLGQQIRDELDEYFGGERRAFSLPVRLDGTDFQRSVWSGLQAIPFGATRSYGELAAAVLRPGAARAVGQANGSNPLPIVVPCHRVVAAGGAIGGYAGDWGEGEGIARKRWLLRHEGVRA